jgi:uncharacterized membrane protein
MGAEHFCLFTFYFFLQALCVSVVNGHSGVAVKTTKIVFCTPAFCVMAAGVSTVTTRAWSAPFASAAVPVSQMSFVFTFLLAVPLFGEPVTKRKAAGLLTAVLAILAFYR